MNYRVFWYPTAERLLDAILAGATESEKIASAAEEIDRQLANSPFNFGESRAQLVRIGFVNPLAVEFEILRDVSTVMVFNVWRTDLSGK